MYAYIVTEPTKRIPRSLRSSDMRSDASFLVIPTSRSTFPSVNPHM